MNITNDQLSTAMLFEQLNRSMMVLGKEIRVRLGQSGSCTTPALDQVLSITGSHGAVNVKYLASLLLITSGAATQHIAALEKLGLVTRLINQQDRREIIIKLPTSLRSGI